MIRIRGFTLVELLVVISIIGILTSVVAVNANTARRQSRDAKRKADIQNVAGALELYRATNHLYPFGPAVDYGSLRSTLSVYSSNIPSDPTNASPGYIYKSDATGSHFFLDVALENSNELATINPTPNNVDTTAITSFVTGTYKVGAITHYRVSGP
jgi:prepilin-type N-terminal cleavage/methylation domain-containing protein